MADFDAFWKAYPHRPACAEKLKAKAYWEGRQKLVDGSFISLDQHDEILEGAHAYAELHGTNDRRYNVCRFLFNGCWYGAIEELARERGKRSDIDATSRRIDELLRESAGGTVVRLAK